MTEVYGSPNSDVYEWKNSKNSDGQQQAIGLT